MNKFMRELKAEELTKYSGGINPTNETVIHDGGGAGPNCRNLLESCMIFKNLKSCKLYDQFC
ncbi:hypothetical protein [Bacillus fungorum]|uniref:Uncharacterized protein n=1 Tax=Bacillus fungorum TaxID=2039284 RepID=A0A2G6Q864_9BACI|nr:hypothetical protein [Bacillus fungorum]PIE93042.1 hypothetical protein CO726_23380 [Bacillus fungorum]